MSFSLIDATDKHMTRSHVSFPRGQHFFPSEASVSWTDAHGINRCSGACMRQVWYRVTGKGEASKPDPYSEWIFALGKAVEIILVEQWKQMGIWVDNNIKFYDKEHNISGEIDVLLRDPGTSELLLAEVKSFYGYMATKDLCGNTKVVGHPKTSQLLQTLIYIDLGQKLGILNYGKMVYYARDSASRTEFDVTIVDDGINRRPCVNGEIDYRFTMEDIYKRYITLAEHTYANTEPPRDYQIAWSPDKIKIMNSIGEVSKTAMADYTKNPSKNPIGDWQCRYCKFSEYCYKDNH